MVTQNVEIHGNSQEQGANRVNSQQLGLRPTHCLCLDLHTPPQLLRNVLTTKRGETHHRIQGCLAAWW